jgi:hypothetical protein
MHRNEQRFLELDEMSQHQIFYSIIAVLWAIAISFYLYHVE